MKYLNYLTVLLLSFSCTSNRPDPRVRLINSNKLYYQLQNYPKTFKPYEKSGATYVIDYSRTGADDLQWFPDEIETLKAKGNLVLSYFSIGEAESYRFYYKDLNKSLIIKENPSWPGNFVVKYWDQSWLDTLVTSEKSYLSKILAQGFDGVYLDIVDAFWGFKDKKKSAERMLILLKEIRKKIGKDRVLIVQNASSIYHYLKDKEEFFKVIDGIGSESTFFHGKKDMNNKYNPQKYVLNNLEVFKKRGKKVFTIEYVNQDNLVDKFVELSKKRGFVPLATDKALKGKIFNK